MENPQKLTKKEQKELRKAEWQEKLEKQKRNAMLKKYGLIAGAVLVVVISVLGLIKLASIPSSTSSINVPAVSQNDIALGDPKSKVTLIEYSDFQCPACAAYHPVVKQILNEFNGKIYFVYRFFPLTNIHKNAVISAQAAYAAKKQNKFWEMLDMLFETQKTWAESSSPEDIFVDYAKKLNLDTTKFKSDMDSSEAQNYVADSQNQALTIGINATPTFFLNGKQLKNPASFDEFKNLIQNELNKK